MYKPITKFFVLFSLLACKSMATIDVGDGSDGTCDLAALSPINTTAKNTYNCTSVSSSGAITVTGTSPLIIKSLYDITISNSINLNGGDGAGGTGGLAIAGGYNGGNNATSGSGLSPSTRGLAGGDAIDNASSGETGGGGGSGGASTTLGQAGEIGQEDAVDGDIPGAGALAPSQTYNSPLSLSTSTTGGSGGGGGGTSTNFGPADTGGAGGAGGGVLILFSGANITINAVITANGGAGEKVNDAGNGAGGSGGGGAGGAIFIRAQDDVIVTASISALGASGGAQNVGNSTGGAGGDGGNGVIRIDDSDGVIVGISNTTPSASSYATSTSSIKSFSSDLSPGCVLRENNQGKEAFILLLVILGIGQFLYRHKVQKASYCR